MEQSKPGKKLNPLIATVTAPIYARDPIRYRRLCLWVWKQQQQRWPDEAIALSLKMADPYVDRVQNWWTYLTSLLPKAKAQSVEIESTAHKSADMALAGQFVEFLKQKQAWHP